MVKAGIIGRGLIGSELYKRLQTGGWNVVGVVNRSGFSKNLPESGTIIPIAVQYDNPSVVIDAFFRKVHWSAAKHHGRLTDFGGGNSFPRSAILK